MADDKKISGLDPFAATPASDDLYVMVDVDEPVLANQTKKVTATNLWGRPRDIGSVTPQAGTFTNLTAQVSLVASTSITMVNTINEFSTDGTLAGNSDSALPTEKAVKTYVDAQIATTDEHNELLGIQGGDATNRYHLTLAEHTGLTNGGQTDLHSHSVAHNNTVGLQGGSIPLDEYYHLDAQTYNQIGSDSTSILLTGYLGVEVGTTVNEFSTDGTLAGNSDDVLPTEKAVKTYVDGQIAGAVPHNSTTGIQGGAVGEYYHLDAQTYNQISSDATSVIFSGDIYCDDLFVSASSITLGSSLLTESATNGGLSVTGDLTASRHMALGNATIDYAGFPTYQALLKMDETFGSGITGAGYGLVLNVANDASNAATITAGLNIASQVASASHLTVQGANITGNVTANSGNTTNVIGITAIGAGAGDNATVTNMIASELVTNLSFGMVGVNVTNMYGSKVKLLNAGSGEVNITNAYGINVLTPGFTSTGTITNIYGLYIEDQSTVGFTNSYNLYSAGANAVNKLEGYLELGSGSAVNEISSDGSLSGDSTSVLVTEQAIKSYVDTQAASDVQGPASSTDNAIPTFDGTSGKLIKDSPNFTYDPTTGQFGLFETGGSSYIEFVPGDTNYMEMYYEVSDGSGMSFLLTDGGGNHAAQMAVLNGDGQRRAYIEVNSDDIEHWVSISGGGGLQNHLNVDINGITLLNGVTVNNISNDPTLSGDSTSAIVTQQAIKSYVDSQLSAEVVTGQESLGNGDSTASITFVSAEADTNYSIGYSLVNTVDSPPSIYASIVTEKTVDGFTVTFSGPLDSANYTLDWSITR